MNFRDQIIEAITKDLTVNSQSFSIINEKTSKKVSNSDYTFSVDYISSSGNANGSVNQYSSNYLITFYISNFMDDSQEFDFLDELLRNVLILFQSRRAYLECSGTNFQNAGKEKDNDRLIYSLTFSFDFLI